MRGALFSLRGGDWFCAKNSGAGLIADAAPAKPAHTTEI